MHEIRPEIQTDLPQNLPESQLEAVRIKTDQEYLSRTLEELRPALFNYCLSFTQTSLNRESDAEDLVQEVMLNAARSISTFTGEASFKTWLFTVAKRAAIDRSRGLNAATYMDRDIRKTQSTDDKNFVESGEVSSLSPEELAIKAEQKKMIDEYLQTLPEIDRELYVMTFREGLTHHEIASRLSIPLGTVKSKLYALKPKYEEAMKKIFKKPELN